MDYRRSDAASAMAGLATLFLGVPALSPAQEASRAAEPAPASAPKIEWKEIPPPDGWETVRVRGSDGEEKAYAAVTRAAPLTARIAGPCHVRVQVRLELRADPAEEKDYPVFVSVDGGGWTRHDLRARPSRKAVFVDGPAGAVPGDSDDIVLLLPEGAHAVRVGVSPDREDRLGVRVLTAPPLAPAPEEAGPAAPSDPRPAWKWDVRAAAALAHDDNTFKLSKDQIRRLDDDLPADGVSGRFRDMDSADDFILSASLEAEGSGKSPLGGTLRVTPRAAYDRHLENEAKSRGTLGLGLRQPVGGPGRLRLDLDHAPDVFKKNYLSDAIDPAGSVSADERRYGHGVYDETSLALAYRHRIVERGPSLETGGPGVPEIGAEVTLGLRRERYESPFHNHDEDGAQAGLDVTVGLTDSLEFELGYARERVRSPGDREVAIRDEPDFGVDFNGDGDALDNNRRTIQAVDRSRDEQAFGVGIAADPAPGWRFRVRYQRLARDYESNAPFDVSHRDREDRRNRWQLGGRWKAGGGWEVEAEVEWTRHKEDLPADPDPDDDTGYRQRTVRVGVTYTF